MKDIAKMAGVSLGTVSRVLNGADNVKGKNTERVLDVVKKTQLPPLGRSEESGLKIKGFHAHRCSPPTLHPPLFLPCSKRYPGQLGGDGAQPYGL
jgi:transcriptional regulator with XRE-family HTH domain